MLQTRRNKNDFNINEANLIRALSVFPLGGDPTAEREKRESYIPGEEI